MQKTPRKPLEPWQKADAGRLKALFADAPAETQEGFGAKHGVGSQALVWQYLNGYIPLNLRAVLKFANGLRCAVSDISPTLAAELPEAQRRQADLFSEYVYSLPADDAKQVLDFLQYKLQRTQRILAKEETARYGEWLESLTEDLQRRKKEATNEN